MARTEEARQKLARYREIRSELKKGHPEKNKHWLNYHSKVRLEMERAS